MEINKIFFCGLGGAGQRHLRIFRELLPPETEFSAYRMTTKTPLLNSDFSINKNSTLEQEYHIQLAIYMLIQLMSIQFALENLLL